MKQKHLMGLHAIAAILLGLAGFAILTASCRTVIEPPPAPAVTQVAQPPLEPEAEVSFDPNAAFEELRDRYFIESLKLYPVIATYLGASAYSPELAEIDGRLRDTSDHARAVEVALYSELQEQLAAIDPSSLSTTNRIDHKVMRAQLSFLLHQLDDIHFHERALDTYVGNPFNGLDWQVQGMTDAGNGLRGSETEWALVVSRLRAIPEYLGHAKSNLSAGKAAGNIPDRRTVQNDGIDGSQANAGYYRTSLPANAEKYLGSRPFAAEMLAQIQKTGSAAAEAYEEFSTFMSETYDLEETVDRYAIGEAEYAWRVGNNFQESRSPAELYDYAAVQVAGTEVKTFEVAEQVALEQGLDLPFGSEMEKRSSTLAVMDALAQDAPTDDDELFAWYREIAQNLVAYGREHDLFDIPDDYKLEIVETPPLLRAAVQAAYFPAPPFKKTGVGRFYLTPGFYVTQSVKERHK